MYAIAFVLLTSRPTGRKREREGESRRESLEERERERRGENTLYTNRRIGCSVWCLLKYCTKERGKLDMKYIQTVAVDREGFSAESRKLAHFNYGTKIPQLDPILQRMRRKDIPILCRIALSKTL